MRKHIIEIVTAILNIVFIAALGIEFMSIANLVGIWWRIAAIIMMVSVYSTFMATLLVTNTRRPAGIDPNDPPEGRDPFSMTTDELWHEGMPDRRSRKRRASDQPDPKMVSRLIEHFEDVDAERPMTEQTPQWARDLQKEHPDTP